jgi:D-glycero-D-manno-heptose 1,7-bisphosphate phosphatase
VSTRPRLHVRCGSRRRCGAREKEPLIRPAVFLDRDGTLVEDVGFLDTLDKLVVYPWTVDTVRAFNRAGLAVVVITNQSGIARGYFGEDFVQETHRTLSLRLAAGGANIEAYYYCPHHPDGSVAAYARACDCRKPRRGLVDRAALDLDLDLPRSFVVGDKWIDVGLARAVGARGVLVRSGTGAAEIRRRPDLTADAIADNLAAAASWIFQRIGDFRDR